MLPTNSIGSLQRVSHRLPFTVLTISPHLHLLCSSPPSPPTAHTVGRQVTEAVLVHDIEDTWRGANGTLGCHAANQELAGVHPGIFGEREGEGGGTAELGAASLPAVCASHCCASAGRRRLPHDTARPAPPPSPLAPRRMRLHA